MNHDFPGSGALASAHEWGVRRWRGRYEDGSTRVRKF